jgi:molybdate transport system ATP-binding protein
MSLEVSAETRLGDFTLDASFVSEGKITAIFGRSGSGKTTLINIIAGLITPERGRVTLDGTALLDTDRNIDVPAYRRRVGYVFQEARLFPHLSVRQNLLYGRRFTPRELRQDPEAVLDLLDLKPLLNRGTVQLSGGEKQRVAIGRALLASPRLLLMDEPLSSLDEARKQEVMPFLERLRDHALAPIVYVSHSVAEVKRLATTIVLLRDGRVTNVRRDRTSADGWDLLDEARGARA